LKIIEKKTKLILQTKIINSKDIKILIKCLLKKIVLKKPIQKTVKDKHKKIKNIIKDYQLLLQICSNLLTVTHNTQKFTDFLK
jgi:hypothetical protein